MKMGELQNMMVTVHSGGRLSPSDQIADHLTKIGLEANRLYHELEMTSAYVDTHQDISYSNAHISLHSHDFSNCCFAAAVRAWPIWWALTGISFKRVILFWCLPVSATVLCFRNPFTNPMTGM